MKNHLQTGIQNVQRKMAKVVRNLKKKKKVIKLRKEKRELYQK